MSMNKHDHKPSVLEVWLNQVRVGTITNLPYDRNLFVFTEDYIANTDRPTLSLSLADAKGDLITQPQEVQTKVPSFFSNVLPEGHLREYLAKRGNIKEAREFFLLWLLGVDLPGAVLVQDAEGRPLPLAEDSFLRESKRNPPDQVLRFSLAGVQLKFSAVGQPNKGLTIPVEGRGGHWIVKLPSQKQLRVPENEYSMMRFAAAVGIDVAEVGLIPTNEIYGLPAEMAQDKSNALYVKRFDRTPDGARIHTEDFNQVYGQFPEAKYKNFSYGNMAGDIWRVLGEQGLTEFIKRLVYTAAIGNADMHLKNWSLIYRDGKTPALAPAYDFVSTIQYRGFDETLALSIAKEKDPRYLDIELLDRFAVKARVPTSLVRDVALATAESIVKKWPELAGTLPFDAEWVERINEQLKYVPITAQFLPTAAGQKSPKRPRPRRDRAPA
ncbi:MAG TPA: HipA domain-containing protein [Candidatus Angelobacter sp.]|nr:HipA domain-containing protein [Candidatus Angelobacter sp.]